MRQIGMRLMERNGVDSRQGKECRKVQSVICNEDDVDGQASDMR